MATVPEHVDPSWRDPMGPAAGQIARMGDFLRAENEAGRGYLPPGPDVLRAFTGDFARVRVLIMGQDPYPTPGHAVGLSFSVPPDLQPVPRSLVNIYREYCEDLGHSRPRSGDLVAVRLCQAGYVIAAGPSRVAEPMKLKPESQM